MKRTETIAFSVVIAIFIIAGGWYYRSSVPAPYIELPVAQLPVAQQSSVVLLKNGDTYTLTASVVKKVIGGHEVRMLAYNGSIPGPTIKVEQGSEVTVHFVNDIDVASTIHSHGIRLDNAFDGVPGVTQKEVLPGGSFDYKIKFPDAGIFWYHPHIDEPYEQSLGLYGNFIVTASDANYWAPVQREIPVTLGDILIGTSGDPVPFTTGRTDHTLMGRFGNILLTQGVEDLELTATKGEVVRLYLTNTANARPFNFTIPGAKMKLVGSDNGRYEKETFVDAVLLAPSERAVVDVFFPEAGKFPLLHKTPDNTYTLGNLTVATGTLASSYAKEFTTLRTNAETVKEFAALAKYRSIPPDKKLRITIDMPGMSGMMQGGGGSMMGGKMMGGMHRMPDGTMMENSGMMMGGSDQKIEWEDTMSMMNAMSDDNSIKWQLIDEDTGMVNMDINWKWKVGDKVKVRIENDAHSMHPMQHPIHFHGQRFVVLSVNGVKNDNMVWKDTTLVQKGDTVDILIDVTNPGAWMAHCHIAEHLADGMMLNFSVAE
jgi:FtsP/CotA-like multicopper oxidase with cupredoxin domain